MTIHIVILRTKGSRFFSKDSGKGWRYFVLNLIPKHFGFYFQVGEYPM